MAWCGVVELVRGRARRVFISVFGGKAKNGFESAQSNIHAHEQAQTHKSVEKTLSSQSIIVFYYFHIVSMCFRVERVTRNRPQIPPGDRLTKTTKESIETQTKE